MTALSDGGFVIVWINLITAPNTEAIFDQRYDVDGQKIGDATVNDEDLIPEGTRNDVRDLDLTELANGDIAFSWRLFSNNDTNALTTIGLQILSAGETVSPPLASDDPQPADYDTVLIGDASDNPFKAGATDDWIEGGDGNDKINGGAGADIFQFGLGNETNKIYDFEIGVDKVALADGLEFDDLVLTTSGALGNPNFLTSAGDSLQLVCVSFDDLSADDFFTLGGTTPPPTGNGALPDSVDQVLFGSDGNDLIRAAAGSDRIDGSAGEDVIRAGLGPDFNVAGGADADVFLFDPRSSLLRIVDFEDGLDKIGLIGDVAFDDLSFSEFNAGVHVNYTNTDGALARITIRATDDTTYATANLTEDDFVAVTEAELNDLLLLV